MNTHDLKIWPEYFDLVTHRSKEFELRRADRPFAPGDQLRLREYDPKTCSYTGRVALSRVTSVLSDLPGLQPGFVAMGVFFLQMETKHTDPVEETEE